MTRCTGRARHWFSLRGHVGFRMPACVSCGAPNPRPLTDDEWAYLVDYRDNVMKRPFHLEGLEAAVSARKAEAGP